MCPPGPLPRPRGVVVRLCESTCFLHDYMKGDSSYATRTPLN